MLPLNLGMRWTETHGLDIRIIRPFIHSFIHSFIHLFILALLEELIVATKSGNEMDRDMWIGLNRISNHMEYRWQEPDAVAPYR